MRTLIEKDGKKIELTDNEFRAIYTLVSNCLYQMGGDEPVDIHDDPLTWTEHETLVDKGWTSAEAKGTYGALEAKGLIDIYPTPRSGRSEDTVCEYVFDMFQPLWEALKTDELVAGLTT